MRKVSIWRNSTSSRQGPLAKHWRERKLGITNYKLPDHILVRSDWATCPDLEILLREGLYVTQVNPACLRHTVHFPGYWGIQLIVPPCFDSARVRSLQIPWVFSLFVESVLMIGFCGAAFFFFTSFFFPSCVFFSLHWSPCGEFKSLFVLHCLFLLFLWCLFLLLWGCGYWICGLLFIRVFQPCDPVFLIVAIFCWLCYPLALFLSFSRDIHQIFQAVICFLYSVLSFLLFTLFTQSCHLPCYWVLFHLDVQFCYAALPFTQFPSGYLFSCYCNNPTLFWLRAAWTSSRQYPAWWSINITSSRNTCWRERPPAGDSPQAPGCCGVSSVVIVLYCDLTHMKKASQVFPRCLEVQKIRETHDEGLWMRLTVDEGSLFLYCDRRVKKFEKWCEGLEWCLLLLFVKDSSSNTFDF